MAESRQSCPTIPVVGVYLLLGDDEERKARGVEKLRRGRAAESFDASGTSPQTVVSALNSFDLFGEGPFVLVRNLDAWNAAQKSVIVDYLQSPTEGADLLLLGKKLGSRERLLSAAKKGGEVHDLQQPTGRRLAQRGVGAPAEERGGGGSGCSRRRGRAARSTTSSSLPEGRSSSGWSGTRGSSASTFPTRWPRTSPSAFRGTRCGWCRRRRSCRSTSATGRRRSKTWTFSARPTSRPTSSLSWMAI